MPQPRLSVELRFLPVLIQQVFCSNTHLKWFAYVFHYCIQEKVSVRDYTVVFVGGPIPQVAIAKGSVKSVVKLYGKSPNRSERWRERDIIFTFQRVLCLWIGPVNICVNKKPRQCLISNGQVYTPSDCFPTGLDNSFIANVNKLLFEIQHPKCRVQKQLICNLEVCAYIHTKSTGQYFVSLLCYNHTRIV